MASVNKLIMGLAHDHYCTSVSLVRKYCGVAMEQKVCTPQNQEPMQRQAMRLTNLSINIAHHGTWGCRVLHLD
jgi:hypothetical protein